MRPIAAKVWYHLVTGRQRSRRRRPGSSEMFQSACHSIHTASTIITTQIAGPAQPWKCRTASMPLRHDRPSGCPTAAGTRSSPAGPARGTGSSVSESRPGKKRTQQHLQGDATPGTSGCRTRRSPPTPRTSAGEAGSPDAPAQPAHDRVRRAGVVAHEAGHAAAAEDDQRAAEDAERDLDRAQAEQEQPGRERVVADVVRVVHPQREQAVRRSSARSLGSAGLQVVVVEPTVGVLGRERAWSTSCVVIGLLRLLGCGTGVVRQSDGVQGGSGQPVTALVARRGVRPELAGGQTEPDQALGELHGGGDAVDDRTPVAAT